MILRRRFDNMDIFIFSISADDLKMLDSFDEGLVTGWNPSDAH